MPCDQIIMNRTVFKDGTDLDIITHALEYEGYTVNRVGSQVSFQKSSLDGGTFSNGVFRATQGFDVDAVKRNYATESVKRTAARMGWRVKIDAKNPQKMQLVKKV